MAGISSVPKELAMALAGGGSTVREQMDALASKAKRLKLQEPILGRAVISWLEDLNQTAKKGSSKLLGAENKGTGVSEELETWLEKVNAAILKANDALDECEYHVRRHEALAPKEPKDQVRSYFSILRKLSLSGKLISINSELQNAFKDGDQLSHGEPNQGAPNGTSAAAHEAMEDLSELESEVGDQLSHGEPDQGAPNGTSAAAHEAMRDLWKLESEVVEDGMQTVVDELLNPGSSKLKKSAVGDQPSLGKPDQGAPNGASTSAAAHEAMKDSLKLESEDVGVGRKTVVPDSDKSSDLSVIFLVGWAETGKTVLARLVYKNSDVMCYFDERMWVQVPEAGDLDTEKIGKRMLTKLSRDNAAQPASEEETVSQLEKRLKGKRFLLVLEGASDTNSTSKFVALKKFLEGLGGFRGSAVLITTGKDRKIKPSFAYPMKLNRSQYCWTLFDKIAFAEGGPIRTPEMEAIVDQCEGNSLYIKLVGSLMHRFKDESQWSSILEKLNKMEDEKLNKMEDSDVIPQLCFNYMSSLPLKRCFHYCYFFPKGYLLRREDLVELWMAQGYLDLPNTSAPADMEARGREYYDILMRSSFFQVSEDDDFDTRSCKIPDVLHGLNLFTEKSKVCFKTIVKGDARDCAGAVHLTLIDCEVKYSISFKSRFSKLRSLRLENTKGLKHLLGSAKGLKHLLGSAKGLRVLIIVDESLKELPDSIGKLTRLRYLDISRTSIVQLPDSISVLYNLQTLRLHDLQYLPKNFDKLLVNMMHLHIHKLENLYEMYNLISECGELVYLSSAKALLKVFVGKDGRIDHTMLHKLSNRCSTISIHCLENASKDASGITAWLSKIPAETERLKLIWSARRGNRIDEDVLEKLKPQQSLKDLTLENFEGTGFPSWMTRVDSDILSNLVKLELENCSWCGELPPLGHLSCLRILKIVGMDNVKSITDNFYGSATTEPVFAKLKEFTLCGMSELKDWNGSTASSSTTTAFPYLERFEVDQCPCLTGIPDIVLTRKAKCLRRFKVSFCDKLDRLPKGLGELKCLENLELFGLPALKGFSLGSANNLKSLIIGCVSEEEGLLKQLEHLSSLTNLTIWGYYQDTIPDCLGELESLEVIKFESCRRLKSLPRISNLKELHISYCPLLEESCIRGSRPEWHKVSHIGTIHVNSEKVREPQTEKMP